MLVVGERIQASVLAVSGSKYVVRCFRQNMRWTIHRSIHEFVLLDSQLNSINGPSLNMMQSFSEKIGFCSATDDKIPMLNIFLDNVLMESSWSYEENTKPYSNAVIEEYLSEFLELSATSLKPELNHFGKFKEGYVLKTPIFYNDEYRVHTSIFFLQVILLVFSLLLSYTFELQSDGWIPKAQFIRSTGALILYFGGFALCSLAYALDMYIRRPESFLTLTLIIPTCYIPFVGPLCCVMYLLFGYIKVYRNKRWLVVRPGYIAYFTSNFDDEPRGVYLFDQSTKVTESFLNPYLLRVSNMDQTLCIHLKSIDEKKFWKLAISSCIEQKIESSESGTRGNWYSDAKFFFDDALDALRNAKHQVFIAGWMISPEIELSRPGGSKLENVLEELVYRGVQVHVLVYRDVEMALPNNSKHAKARLSQVGVQIIRHAAPSRVLAAQNHLLPFFRVGDSWWSHHEKVIIVDQQLSFVGGIDLAFGRYDDINHRLTDIDEETWSGKDYYNPREKDFENLHLPYIDSVDRKNIVRMPWHDIHCCIVGDIGASLHFIARWNRELRQLSNSTMAMKKSQFRYLLPAKFQVETLLSTPYSLQKVQLLRSVGPWSLTERIEKSIADKYVEIIAGAREFIYIENQFFNSRVVADALYERIWNTLQKNQPFRVIVVLPQWPAFEGMPFDNPSSKAVLHFQHATIDHLINRLALHPAIQNGSRTLPIQFYSLRKAEFFNNQLVSEQVYVHSKLIIVDDEICIIGSANLNRRSLDGDRDSELAVCIYDRFFCLDLRYGLFIEHLGLHSEACVGCRLCSSQRKSTEISFDSGALALLEDPLLWNEVASVNSSIFERILPGIQPTNEYTTVEIARVAYASSKAVNSDTVHELFHSIRGQLVEIPLKFLRDERTLLPTVTTDPVNYILPYETYE